MAQYGRVRLGVSLFSKLGLLSSQRSNLQHSVIAPSITLVPIAIFGGSENYASALYIAAVKANAVEKVDSELLQFFKALKGSKLTSQFLKDISIAKDVRVKVVQDISAAAMFLMLQTISTLVSYYSIFGSFDYCYLLPLSSEGILFPHCCHWASGSLIPPPFKTTQTSILNSIEHLHISLP